MKSIFTAFLALSPLVLCAQQTQNSGKYAGDFNFFIKSLIETHPDPYSGFGNQIEFYRAKQMLQDELPNINTDHQFVIALNKFLANLEDGHTIVYDPSKENEAGATEYPLKRLPLKLKASSDYLFVQNSTDEFKDLIGAKIIAINGVPVTKMLDDVSRLYPTENISGAFSNLISAVKDNKSVRDLLEINDMLSFTCLSGGGQVIRKIPYQEQTLFLPENQGSDIQPGNNLLFWTMVGKRKNIGYFLWNSVASREMVEEVNLHNSKYTEVNLNAIYNDALHQKRSGDIESDIMGIPSLYEQFYLLMKEMKARNSKYLIIDLRKNGGGMSALTFPLVYILYGNKYLEYQSDVEYIKKISPLYLKKIGLTLEAYNKNSKGNCQLGDYVFDNFFGGSVKQTIDEKRKKIESGYFNVGSENIKKAIGYAQPDIKVIVLTSPETFSAAYHFLFLLREVGNAKIVGVASKQAGNTFMENTPFELPDSKIRGSFSNAKQVFFKNDPISGKLLKPDFEMTWNEFSKFGFIQDAELLKALELIESEENNL